MSDLETKCVVVVEIVELRGKDHAEAYEAISKMIGPITDETCERKDHEVWGMEDDIWYEKDGNKVSHFRFSPHRHDGVEAAYDHDNKRWGLSQLILKTNGDSSGGMFIMFESFTRLAKMAMNLGEKIALADMTPGEPCIESKTWYNGVQEPVSVSLDDPKEPQPYIEKFVGEIKKKYNSEYGDDRVCKCGHPYHRHFDGYEDNSNVGCKYCSCWDFEEDEDGSKSNNS